MVGKRLAGLIVIDDRGQNDKLARKAESAFEQRVRSAVRQIERDGINEPSLSAAVEARLIEAAINSVNVDPFRDQFSGIKPKIDRLSKQTATVMHNHILDKLDVKVSLDPVLSRAGYWSGVHGSQLVVDVTDETRNAIRTVITRNIQAGREPGAAVKRLRETIGLTDRMAASVERRRDKLEESDLSARQIDREIKAYKQSLIDWRAENIARTETMTAANMGMQSCWEQHDKDRAFAGFTSSKVWLIADNDADALCESLDGTEVGIRDLFDGKWMQPPAHPQCRCTSHLKLEKDE